MVEKILAGIGLAVSVGLLIAMLLGTSRARQLLSRVRTAWRWNRQRRSAHREAVEVIERARRADRPSVTREGNVYRPSSFNGRANDDERS